MNFWRLFSPDQLAGTPVSGHHNHLICLAAVLIAVMAAGVLLPVTDRFHRVRTHHRWLWLAAGSFAMGIGIWAMHFTSMLAFNLPFPIRYDVSITAFSILPAVMASATSILFIEAARRSRTALHIASLCMAVGIGSMHYVGMEAIIVPARMYYVPAYFFLSIAAAYALACLGLHAKIRFSRNPRSFGGTGTLVGSAVLGLAVSCMHFLAMQATYFIPETALAASSTSMTAPLGLIAGILASTLVILAMIILGMIVDRRLGAMASSLAQSETRFQRLAETTQTAIFTFDADGFRYANPALSTITGYPLARLMQMSLGDVLGLEFSDYAKHILESGIPREEARYRQLEVVTAGGEMRWLYLSLTLAELGADAGTQAACLATACDISEQKKAEFTLHRMAYSDALTGLGNRSLLLQRLQEFLARDGDPETCEPCLMLLDLDNFKLINDTFGHLQGDQLLVLVAERLASLAGPRDTLARLGGDEFVLLFAAPPCQPPELGDRLVGIFSRPFKLNGKALDIRVSIGIVPLARARQYREPDQVLHNVDIALYRAKSQPHSDWSLYDEAMDRGVKRSRLLTTELTNALLERGLTLHYQPIVEAATQRVKGFEALARWRRGNGEWVAPAEFIALAEARGMVADIGLWAVEEACDQLARWQQCIGQAQPYVSVNIAADSFDDERFYRLVADCISRHGLAPRQLRLELTERILVADTAGLPHKLDSLIEMGCELMIDDFGTGYSSLAYLHKLPVKTLKIDRSFIKHLGTDQASHTLVRSIIALANSLGLETISEGVETREQATLLRQLGSTHLQGFLFSAALPPHQAARLLESSQQASALTTARPAQCASPAEQPRHADLHLAAEAPRKSHRPRRRWRESE